MESIYDEKELEEYYDVFKVETERFVEEIYRKGFDKGMERIWEYLNYATSLNSDKYEKLFGSREIADILREFSPIVFINTMDTIDPKKLKELRNMIAQREDPKNIDDEYELGIKELWEGCLSVNYKLYGELSIRYRNLKKDLLRDGTILQLISLHYSLDDECSRGVIDLYESLEALSKLTRTELGTIIGSAPYEIIRKTPEELIQIMKPYLEKKEDNND